MSSDHVRAKRDAPHLHNPYKLAPKVLYEPESLESLSPAHIAKSFFISELKYVNYVLRVLVEEHVQQLNEHATVSKHINTANIQGIFSNIVSIYELHKDILDELVYAQFSSNGNLVSAIAASFSKRSRFFVMYSMYVTGVDRSLEHIISATKSDPELSQILEAKKHITQNSLRGYLLIPLYRLELYVRYFGALVLSISNEANHEEAVLKQVRETLTELMDIVNDISNRYNDEKNRALVVEMSHKFDKASILSPSRSVVKEGNLTLIKHNGKRIIQKQAVLLVVFNDQIAIGSFGSGSLLSGMFSSSRMQKVFPIDRVIAKEVPKDWLEGLPYGFTVSCDGDQTFCFSAASPLEQTSWINGITQTSIDFEMLSSTSAASVTKTEAPKLMQRLARVLSKDEEKNENKDSEERLGNSLSPLMSAARKKYKGGKSKFSFWDDDPIDEKEDEPSTSQSLEEASADQLWKLSRGTASSYHEFLKSDVVRMPI